MTSEFVDSKHSAISTGTGSGGGSIAPIPFSRYLGEPFNNDDIDDLQAFFLLTHDFNPDWTVNLRFSTQQFDAHYLAVGATNTFLADNRSVERTF